GFLIPFTVAAIVIPAQIFIGDVVAREAYRNEPAKFADIELLTRTSTHVPETLGGLLTSKGTVRFGIRLPDFASLLAGFSVNTRITGLDAIPAAVRPETQLVNTVHTSFDIMVGSGFALLFLALWFAWAWVRKRDLPATGWFLRASALAGLVSIVALETGWIVTEVGRQPWTVVGLLLTRDAVTRSGNVWLFFAGSLVIIGGVGVGAIAVLLSMSRRWHRGEDHTFDVPYSPDQPPFEEVS
ncbi:MAG TPA: cytochrome ubiquinol oxidase subunit I, partial [Actinomycetota bacterium]|nr:cytochrome ubiquinol oxidase subunit I [Actinomycetota bacterium]